MNETRLEIQIILVMFEVYASAYNTRHKVKYWKKTLKRETAPRRSNAKLPRCNNRLGVTFSDSSKYHQG